MANKRLALLLWFAFPMFLAAQGVEHQNFAQSIGPSNSVRALPFASISVCNGTTLPSPGVVCTPLSSSIFTGPSLSTPASNPLTADATSNFSFWAAGGSSFVISISSPGFITYSYSWTAPLTTGATTTGSPVSGNLAVFSGPTSLTNGNLSGDALTSGTTVVTVTGLRNLALPTLAASTGFLFDSVGSLSLTTSAANLTTGTLPHAQLPALLVTDVPPGMNGQCLNTSGGISQWGSCAGTAGEQVITTPNTTGSTVNANSTSFQSFSIPCTSSPCYGGGAINSLGKAFRLHGVGTINSIPGTPQISWTLIMGGVSGSGNASHTGGTAGNTLPWFFDATCIVTATGATGTLICFPIINGTNVGTTAGVTSFFNVDLTSALSPTIQVAFGTASSSNTATQQYAYLEQLN